MQCENDYFLWVLYWNVGTNYSWWWHSPFYISVSEGSTALKWAAPDMQMYRHFLGDHSFSGCVKFSENLTLLNLWYHMCAYQGVRHVSFSGKNCICNIKWIDPWENYTLAYMLLAMTLSKPETTLHKKWSFPLGFIQ